jgi:transcriptional regulator with XRE-family HTH domain
METQNFKNFKKLVSGEDTSWLNDLDDFNKNSNWLDISFEIALSVLSKLSENKINKEGIYNQKLLAQALGCSAQYVNKLLKGNENLTLDTICNLQNVLNIKLIEVTKYEAVSSYSFEEIYENISSISSNVAVTESIDYNKVIGDLMNVSIDNTSYALAA